ncbi:hypothetical protein O6H91_19G000100 [Diphasiastrum complanatum]|uniref:Uncharacterized protein n=1 Tax=Diphasiastrum complanatum TaxID=34168 RepID=A0ACC2ARU3_DIPCM|nr:hypothetical protein O6H91_19G000100 [Diphasiastrum complanatum]
MNRSGPVSFSINMWKFYKYVEMTEAELINSNVGLRSRK